MIDERSSFTNGTETNQCQQAPTVLDLFAGAGGTGLGFRSAGFRIVGAVEKSPSAAATYSHNLNVRVEPTDIAEISTHCLREKLGLARGELSVLVGCPPCQGFTRLRNAAGASDSRNGLVKTYVDFVAEFMPRVAMFENVPGITRMQHGREHYAGLCGGLRSLGYRLAEYMVDAADYGVPQHRQRVLILAGRDFEPSTLPAPTHGAPDDPAVIKGERLPWKTVRDTIVHLPRLEAGENGEMNGKYPNHIAPKTGARVLDFIRRVPPDGGSRAEVSKEYWLPCHHRHAGHWDVYGRLRWDEPAGTITSGCTNPSKGRFVHPEQYRGLTPREAAALQGFPNDYLFIAPGVSIQIGNAVPPPLAHILAETLRDTLAGASCSCVQS